MRQQYFWRRQVIILAGLFLAAYLLSMTMIAIFPLWPPAGVVILGGVVLAILWNLLINVWTKGGTTTKIRHLVDQVTELAVGLGLLAAFVLIFVSFSIDAPQEERWLKIGAMVFSLAPGILLVLRPLRTILFFVTKPWRR